MAVGTAFANSWSLDLSVTDISPNFAWSLSATVKDVAGNTSVDTTPTVINPVSVTISEAALVDFPSGVSKDSNIRIEAYDSIFFSLDQPSISQLKSQGETLTITGQGTDTLQASRSDGSVVLQAVINADNTATVTLFDTVDQGGIFGDDTTFNQIFLDATQNDADGTSETVKASLGVFIREASAFTNDDFYNVIEDEFSKGNVFQNDNLIEGPLELIFVQAEGKERVVTSFAPAHISTSKGELTVYHDGRWTFEAARNLDNTQVQQLTFTYGALDADEDYSRSDVILDIADGQRGAFPSSSVELNEPDYDDFSAYIGQFTITAGSDNLVGASLRFSPSQVLILNNLNYTSNGDAIVYTLENGGTDLVASVSGTDVFRIALTGVEQANGDLLALASFTQFFPLDHVNTDSLFFPLFGVAEDIDGTISGSTSTLILKDGNNPSLSADTAFVDEDMLSPTDDSQVLNVGIGSDEVVDIYFLAADKQPKITSNGEALEYEVSGNGRTLTAYTNANGVGDPHFIITIANEPNLQSDSTIGYTITLYKAVDQLDAFGNSILTLDLDFKYAVIDFDGDETKGDLNILIDDDQSGTGSDIALTVSEPPRKIPNLNIPTELTENFSVTANKDPFVKVVFDLSASAKVLDNGGNEITQSGDALIWKQKSETTWVAKNKDGETVLKVQLPDSIDIDPGVTANIPFTIQMEQQIDHGDFSVDPVSPTDSLVLPVPVKVIDADGTELQINADITILDGRDPIAVNVSNLAVDEGGTITGEVDVLGPSYIIGGSDALYDFELAIDPSVTITTNGGGPVTLATSPDNDAWWIATDSSGDEVFRARISTLGVTEFTLSKAIDHTPTVQGEENFDLIFNVSARDFDGDLSNIINWTVQIQDDIPLSQSFTETLTEGESRNFNLLPDAKSEGADGASLTMLIYDSNPPVNIPRDGFVDVFLSEAGQIYSKLRIYSDGRAELDTIIIQDANFQDTVSFRVVDNDGDSIWNTLTLDIKDEEARIDISPLTTLEDTAIVLTLTADPGDIDDGESIQEIIFDNAKLQGSTLTLNGVVLPTNADGDPYLSVADGTLVVTNVTSQTVEPNGTLTFLPALNISDPTHDVDFDVKVVVQANSGERTTNADFNVNITPVVDEPVWDQANTYAYVMDEDGTPPDLNLQAHLFDTDGSEELSYRVENIAPDLILKRNDKVLKDGDTLNENQISKLNFEVPENYSGQLQFTLFAVSKETSTKDKAEVSQVITIDVQGVADKPKEESSNVFALGG